MAWGLSVDMHQAREIFPREVAAEISTKIELGLPGPR